MTQEFYSPIGTESVSATTATNSVEVGFRTIYKAEEYIYVYNAGSQQIIPGNGAMLTTGASGYSVTVSSVVNTVNPMVGVCNHATIATGYYGFIMTKGFRNVVAASAMTGAFINLCLVADGKFNMQYPLTDAVHIGTFAVCGYAVSANTGAGGTVYAKIGRDF